MHEIEERMKQQQADQKPDQDTDTDHGDRYARDLSDYLSRRAVVLRNIETIFPADLPSAAEFALVYETERNEYERWEEQDSLMQKTLERKDEIERRLRTIKREKRKEALTQVKRGAKRRRVNPTPAEQQETEQLTKEKCSLEMEIEAWPILEQPTCERTYVMRHRIAELNKLLEGLLEELRRNSSAGAESAEPSF